MSNIKTTGLDKISQHWVNAKNFVAQLKPKVGLKLQKQKSGTYLLLQFTIPLKNSTSTRVNWTCNCDYTIEGINQIVEKAKLVSNKLSKSHSYVEFKEWYERNIKSELKIADDVITFGEAIKCVEDYFFSGYSQSYPRVNDKNHSKWNSWWSSYDSVYYQYFKHLPLKQTINFSDMFDVINSKCAGSSARNRCIQAMKKLCECAGIDSIKSELCKLDKRILSHRNPQTIGINDFVELHDAVWEHGVNSSTYTKRHLETRRRWLWTFSMQVVYGLRIHEVFAIANIDEPYTTKDNVVIPSLKDPNNTNMIIVVGNETCIGTTTKTGFRFAVPNIHPEYPDIIDRLRIKEGKLPDNRPRPNSSPSTIKKFFPNKAHRVLRSWQDELGIDPSKQLTQTHALRHLSNYIAKISGKSDVQTSLSFGHSVRSNTTTYMKRRTSQTAIDLLVSKTQPLSLQGAVALLKSISGNSNDISDGSLELISGIYGVDLSVVKSLL
ncbi:MAG: hypothetical protein SWX82_34535 [Cyanobacteriota bacterium]|nr:hypothetical protein [Cyanobacteriota bacterium]